MSGYVPNYEDYAVESDRDEYAEVTIWRQEQLEKVGCSRLEAFKLAQDHSIDLHHALKLILQGCAPETLVDVLT